MAVEINSYDLPVYHTLESLIKRSDGLYTKAGHYFVIFKDNSNEYVGNAEDADNLFGISFDESKEKLLTVGGIVSWADYGSRSKIPYVLYYVVDEHGVKAKYKLGGKGNLRDSWAPVKEKTKLMWERSVEVSGRSEFALADEEKERIINKQKAVSNHVGRIKEKLEFEADVVFVKEIPNEFGVSTLYVFKDDEGNKFKTFYSGNVWQAERGDRVFIKGTVKLHDEYKGEKSTGLTRAKVKVLDPDA